MDGEHRFPLLISTDRVLALLDKNLVEGIFYIEDDEIKYVNSSFITLFGYHVPAEIYRIGAYQLFLDYTVFAKLKADADSGVVVKSSVLQFVRKDFTVFYGSLNFEKIHDGRGSSYIATVVDITQRIETENELRKKNEELEKLNAQLDRFLYSASHDIRQPLTSMMGLIRLFRMDPLRENAPVYIDRLEQSVVKLDEFLTQVMGFSKNSHERIKHERIDVVALVHQLIAEHAGLELSHTIDFEVTGSTEMVFYSDSMRLKTILEQVIRNCIQYCDPEKASRYVKITITQAINNLIIEVTDNGIGIGKGHLGKVLDMFYRATERSAGSGLGLYIVKETLLKLKGEISIDSEICSGTTVRIEIPNSTKGKLINRKKNMTKQRN